MTKTPSLSLRLSVSGSSETSNVRQASCRVRNAAVNRETLFDCALEQAPLDPDGLIDRPSESRTADNN